MRGQHYTLNLGNEAIIYFVLLALSLRMCRPGAPGAYRENEPRDHGLTFSTLEDNLVKRVSINALQMWNND